MFSAEREGPCVVSCHCLRRTFPTSAIRLSLPQGSRSPLQKSHPYASKRAPARRPGSRRWPAAGWPADPRPVSSSRPSPGCAASWPTQKGRPRACRPARRPGSRRWPAAGWPADPRPVSCSRQCPGCAGDERYALACLERGSATRYREELP
jgi:hypothetical protein